MLRQADHRNRRNRADQLRLGPTRHQAVDQIADKDVALGRLVEALTERFLLDLV